MNQWGKGNCMNNMSDMFSIKLKNQRKKNHFKNNKLINACKPLN